MRAFDGRIDPSFNLVLGTPAPLSQAVPLPDGGWIVRGEIDRVGQTLTGPLVKILADGALDPSFRATAAQRIQHVLRQPSGDLLCVSDSSANGDVTVTRLRSDGSPDATFHPFTERLSGSFGVTDDIALDLQGRIYFYKALAGTGEKRIVRYQADGRVDAGFTPLAATSPMIVLEENGRAYLRGESSYSPRRERLHRIGETGATTLAAEFTVPNDAFVYYHAPIMPTADGKLLVALAMPSGTYLQRLDAAGHTDSSFAPYLADGLISAYQLPNLGVRVTAQSFDETRYYYSITDLDRFGTVVAEATFSSSNGLLGFRSDGSLLTHTRSGRNTSLLQLRAGATAAVPLGPEWIFETNTVGVGDVATAPNGRWAIYGSAISSANGIATAGLAAFGVDGSMDLRAGQTLLGRYGAPLPRSQYDLPHGLGVAADGSVHLTFAHSFTMGSDYQYSGAYRFRPDGSPDDAWSLRAAGAQSDAISSWVPDATGRVVALRSSLSFDAAPRVSLYRLLADGTPDQGFFPGLPTDRPQGVLTDITSIGIIYPTMPPPARIYSDPDGGLLIAYFRSSEIPNALPASGLLRLRPDGTRDPDFNAGALDEARGWAPGTPRILDVQRTSSGTYVLHSPPSPNSSFSPSPIFEAPKVQVSKIDAQGRTVAGFPVNLDVAWDECRALFVQSDGRYVVTGDFVSAGGRERIKAARFTSAGAVDGSFRAEVPPTFQTSDGTLYAHNVVPKRPVVKLTNEPLPPQVASGAGQLVNLSTRGWVGVDDRIMIAGFVLGSGPCRVLLRAMGPSLAAAGVTDALADPEIELISAAGVSVARNDNWRSANADEIEAAGLAPASEREAVILATLPPGAYTVLVRGIGRTEGNALIEAYQLDGPGTDSPPPVANAPRALNLSTRAFVGAGDRALIGGFAVRGGKVRVVIRAVGPSLGALGLAGSLASMELFTQRSRDGRLLFTGQTIRDRIQSFGQPSTAPLIFTRRTGDLQTVVEFPEGNYTIVVYGSNGTTGLGLFEIYELPAQ